MATETNPNMGQRSFAMAEHVFKKQVWRTMFVAEMARVCLLPQWCGLADEVLEGGGNLLNSRRLLTGNLTNAMFEKISTLLRQQRLPMCVCTVVDAAAVDAETGLVNSVVSAAATGNDVAQADGLQHCQECVGFGDPGFLGVAKREPSHGRGCKS